MVGSFVYSVNTEERQLSCLTCELDEVRCQYVDVEFSPSANFYILNCQGPGIPYYSLRSPQETAECEKIFQHYIFLVIMSFNTSLLLVNLYTSFFL